MQSKPVLTMFVGAAMTLALTGCGAHRVPAPTSIASRFTDAISADDGRAACRLLAPRTRSTLQQSAGKACASAILEEDLPDAGDLQRARAFGTMAQVRFAGDVVFLSEFPSGWRVLAAGCSSVPYRPYDCRLQGG